ncbi:hypothetical protein VST7929_02655 [Vibrio stylophorae]|uniref:CDP-glycerol:poly(Glycerophosphate) glycerophosphotransferase n=1 Tax=Vibrio stylophorae TaxID=659351 RepID=A0ABN8DXR8_9VIBR|nr:CDP-glycerol glycerophosphotransferase family protein [Vibrio stylophorae]CAH0534705.1 hypothetical protein VST7929_02655 [Vibrio stylophorae]
MHIRKILSKVKRKLLRAEHQRFNETDAKIENLECLIAVIQKENLRVVDELRRNNIRYFSKKISVIYVFQQVSLWNSFKSVYEVMLADDCFDVKLLVSPFYHDEDIVDNVAATSFLDTNNIPYNKFCEKELDIIYSADVVFYQTPYDSTLPKNIYPSLVARSGARIAYIPYGLDSGGGNDNLRWQYDLDCHNLATWIFVRSELHKSCYNKYCSKGNDHVYVTGHPKFDQLDCRGVTRENILNRDIKTVLWTPHFSIEDGGWSTFHIFYEKIIELAEEFCFKLVIRPHPLFYTRINMMGGKVKDKFDFVLNKIKQLDNVTLSEPDDSYVELFHESDLLLADAGSFLLEYLPLGKPIIYLNNLLGPGLNDSVNFLDSLYVVSDGVELESCVTNLLNGNDSKLEIRFKRIHEELYLPTNGTGVEISRIIKSFYKLD